MSNYQFDYDQFHSGCKKLNDEWHSAIVNETRIVFFLNGILVCKTIAKGT